jgi:apolipoprotein N-acyltransferase
MVTSEWAQHTFTPFASWGAAAYTQLDNQPLLQVASIAGLAGPGFLVYWVAAALEEALASGIGASRRLLATALGAVVAAHSYGALRLAQAGNTAEDTVLVAAVKTDSTISGLPLPSPEETAAWDETLFARTERAAASGARLAVWPEAATMVRPEDEAEWLERARVRVKRSGADVVVAYVVPLSLEQFRYANRYRMILSDGTIDHTYHKHRPVPGEPSEPGTEPVLVSERDYGRVSGAICYDYDFPYLGLAHSRSAVDIVAVPSSDWRGIDPVHTQMAAVRAIEGGHSVLRSTRWGLSAGIDHHGRIRAWSSDFDKSDGVLFARLPKHGVTTVYGVLGDWFVLAAALFAITVILVPRFRSQVAADTAAVPAV